jgi:signal transduction histidine kinase
MLEQASQTLYHKMKLEKDDVFREQLLIFHASIVLPSKQEERWVDQIRLGLLENQWGLAKEYIAKYGQQIAAPPTSHNVWYLVTRWLRKNVLSVLIDARETTTHYELLLDIHSVFFGGYQHLITSKPQASGPDAEGSSWEIQESLDWETLYRKSFCQSSLGTQIYHWDNPPDLGSFRLLATNPASMEMTGNDSRSFLNRTITDSTPSLLQTEVPGYYAKAILNNEKLHWEILYGDEIHDTYFYKASCFPLMDNYVGVIFENISEQKRTERELTIKMNELERSNQDLDEFAYIASHDLRSPLRDIDNLASWIIEDLPDTIDQETTTMLARLRQRTQRMEQLLDDLLAYSRAGRSAYQQEEINTYNLVEDVLKLVNPPANFRIVLGNDFPTITGPRVPLLQILQNLISNAIIHHDLAQGVIEINATSDGKVTHWQVKDDGPGIAQEHQERVFGMFQTLRPRDDVEGSGMGLAIVRKQIESQKCTIQLHSQGRGCLFSFTWPCVWNPADSTQRMKKANQR